MANKKVALTNSQIGFLLNDIAMAAQAIDRFTVHIACHKDERDLEAARLAIETMAQRIGYLADMAADRVPGTTGATRGADAEDWMMPPAYHWDYDKAENAA